MNNYNEEDWALMSIGKEEDWPIISDDYEPLIGGGSSGNEFTGA